MSAITTVGSSITASIGGQPCVAVGGYHTDPTLLPFIQEQVIGIAATGMRPGTQLYVFFDNKLVSSVVTPAVLDFSIQNPKVNDYYPIAAQGSALYSDGTGKAAGLLYLPPSTYYTGAKTIIIADVSSLSSLSSATTSASYVFNAFNFTTTVISGTTQGTVSGSTQDSVSSCIVSTRPVTTASSTVTDSSNYTTTNVINNLTPSISVSNVYNIITTSPTYSSTANTIITGGTLNSAYQQPISCGAIQSMTDPLAQSFFVDDNLYNSIDGIYVTSANLYFQSKDSNLGVTVDIVTMQNGTPTNVSLPFSAVHLNAAAVNTTSQNGLTASSTLTPTNIVFKAPVFLPSGNYYALRITPDGNNPNYTVYTAAVGQNDLITNNPVTSNWGSGDLFTSTNDQTWVPIQNEYLTFSLNMAQFNTSSGYVTLTNRDYEYLMVANVTGHYLHGEYAFQANTNLFANGSIANSGNVFIISGNTISINPSTYSTIPGGGFTTTTPGITANTKLVVSNGSAYDVVIVSTVNSSVITTRNIPKFSTNSISGGTIQLTPLGTVKLSDVTNYAVTLDNSTATTGFVFNANATLVGVSSKTTGTVATVRNKVINRFNPYFSTTTFPGSTLQFSMQNAIRNASGTTTYGINPYTNYALNNTNYFLNNEIVVMSKSNEIIRGTGKSLIANVAMYSANGYISPSLDLQSSSIIAYRNLINNSTLNENTKSGQTKNKYISQTVNLAAGLNSEAFNVYLNAYWPPNTTINVYGKFLCATDPGTFDSKDWTLLTLVNGNGIYSNPYNLNSINEYQFTLPTLPPAINKLGAISTVAGNNIVTGSSTAFTSDVAVGSLITLFSDSTQVTYQVAQVASVANNTSLTLSSGVNFTTTYGTYQLVTQPQQAFQNNGNGGIIRYYASQSGVPYDSYISFAIKIDLLSTTTYQVPRVMSLRSIASTV